MAKSSESFKKRKKELEDLGWGIEIMDNVTYELINSLFNKK